MLENSIRLDAQDLAASKIIHKDVIEDVIEDDQEVAEAGESSVVTPIAFHAEGILLDVWLDSQLRDIFAIDISNSFGIPPGFENSRPSVSLSVRQLRKKLKECFVELVSQGVDVANHLGASRKI